MSETAQRLRLPVKDQRVEDLVLWRDPKKTAAVFGGATLAFLFLQFGKYNLLSLGFYALSATVFAMLLWNVLGGVLKRPAPQLPAMLSDGIPEAQLRAYADRITPLVNKGLSLANRAISGRDPVTSLASGTGLYFAGRLSASLSLLAMAYLPVLAAFTLPKIYELKKPEIDNSIDAGRSKATALHDKYLAGILAKIPRAQVPSPAESSTIRKTE